LVFDVDQGDPWSPITSTPAIAVESLGHLAREPAPPLVPS
jgi:hypothetical protein